MSPASSILSALAAALVASAAHAAEPVKVEKADLEKLLAGKTINYANVNGSAAIVVFGADGRVTYRAGAGGRTSTGTWAAEDGGRYCVKIASGTASDHCRHVWKTDAGYALGTAKGENLVPVSGLD
jgi:hypothetical protein